MRYTTENEAETRALGKQLAERFTGGEIVTLSGDLGAGKTVFAKGIADGLRISDTVVSPTFALLNVYEGRLTLYHYDAYRLQSADEAYDAGLTEYFGDKSGVCVLEWWENIADVLTSYKKIAVTIAKSGEQTREIDIVDE